MTIAKELFNRRWWWSTLVVIVGMLFLARLGIWQLDRLEQRRARNAVLAEQLAQPPQDVLALVDKGEPRELANRAAFAQGQLDYDRQVLIKSQILDGQPGVYLVTPLRLAGTDQAILVNRGWIPADLADPSQWARFQEEPAQEWRGYLLPSQKMPDGSTSPIPDTPQREWYRLDVEAIQSQMPYKLLPVVLVLEAEPGRAWDQLPRRLPRNVALDEGSHLSYALQWFAFALMLGIGYIAYVRKHRDETPRRDASREEAARGGSREQEPLESHPDGPAEAGWSDTHAWGSGSPGRSSR